MSLCRLNDDCDLYIVKTYKNNKEKFECFHSNRMSFLASSKQSLIDHIIIDHSRDKIPSDLLLKIRNCDWSTIGY